MHDKTIYKLQLGDAEVTLEFKVGTLRRMKTLLGKDPLSALIGADTVEVLEFSKAITEAGMLVHDPKADVTKLEQEFDRLSVQKAQDIIAAFNEAMMPDTSPEGSQDTQ